MQVLIQQIWGGASESVFIFAKSGACPNLFLREEIAEDKVVKMFTCGLTFAINKWNDELVFIDIFGSASSLNNSIQIKTMKRVLKVLHTPLSSLGISPHLYRSII